MHFKPPTWCKTSGSSTNTLFAALRTFASCKIVAISGWWLIRCLAVTLSTGSGCGSLLRLPMSIVLFCKSCLNLVFHSVCELFGPAFLVILFQTKLWSWRGSVNQWHETLIHNNSSRKSFEIWRKQLQDYLYRQIHFSAGWPARTGFKIQTQITTHDCSAGVRGLPSIVARIFPTNVCRKRQTFLVSDKHLSETTSVCRWNWTLTEKNLRKHIGQQYMICRMKNDKHTLVGICRFFLVFVYTKSVYVGHYY